MSMARRFNGAAVRRLIASVPISHVERIDELLKLRRNHPARGNRAEFIRLAILEKLAREEDAK